MSTRAGKVKITHPDRVFYPDSGITKADVIDYYRAVADEILTCSRGRAATLRRFPEGIGEDGFYQRNIADYFPDYVHHREIETETGDGAMEAILLDNESSILYVANLGALELHIALARAKTPDRPEEIILDLDPSDDDFNKVQDCAGMIHDRLDAAGIGGFVKTTGSRGLHIHIPLRARPEDDFDTARAVARGLAQAVVDEAPDLATLEQRKDKRGDKVFIDTLRNAYGQSAIAPYSLRARKNAPVATPMDWDEALAPGMRADKYTIRTLPRRLSRKHDAPWAGFARAGKTLGTVGEALGST